MERERILNRERVPDAYAGFDATLEKFVQNQLPVNEVMARARGVRIESDPSTWVSSTRGKDIRIGEQKVPESIARQFGWGVDTAEKEYVVKVAHEYAHIVQTDFDPHLLAWLDGANEAPEESLPYIQLYALLAELKGVNGLSQLPTYHEQNRTTGNLDVPTYEDMAETIGSYLLGLEYFLYRLQNSRVTLSQEQAEQISAHVVMVVDEWKKLHA